MKNKLPIIRPERGMITTMNPDAKLRGFTLVEMLVATAILVLILTMTLQITNYASTLFLSTRKRIDTFQEARAGFEVMTRRVSQAMLNTYWDYSNGTVGSGTGSPRPSPGSTAAFTSWFPTQYLRQSELHFLSAQAMSSSTQSVGLLQGIGSTRTNTVLYTTDAIFFQAPTGYTSNIANAVLPNLLNPTGYFIEFASDAVDRPNFLASATGLTILPLRYRFRLKELSVPAENNTIYSYTTSSVTSPQSFPPSWMTTPLLQTPPLKRTIAENVIALVILPMLSPLDPPPANISNQELAPHYGYDSRAWNQTGDPIATNSDSSGLVAGMRNQLPPMVQVTMVAIDEASAARLNPPTGASSTAMPTFTDSQSLPGGAWSATGTPNIFLTASNSPGSGQYEKYRSDLSNLEQALTHQHITYRVFTTNVSILQARWSN